MIIDFSFSIRNFKTFLSTLFLSKFFIIDAFVFNFFFSLISMLLIFFYFSKK